MIFVECDIGTSVPNFDDRLGVGGDTTRCMLTDAWELSLKWRLSLRSF